jgi:cytochrome c biogenesis protein CcmG/thiol:disulfide interchange protein DsbE
MRLQRESVSAAQPLAAPSLPEGLALTDTASLLERAKQPGARGLLVNVWASWCGSCREEIPLLMTLYKALAIEHVELAFVSADQPDGFARAVEIMGELHGPSPVLAVTPGTIGTFKRALSPRWRGGIPATFLFDPQGKLQHLWEGPVLEHEVTNIVQRYLAGEPIEAETRTAAEPN